MARKKQIKKDLIKTFENVFEFDGTAIDKKINMLCGTTESFILEVGCGHADYTVKLAQKYNNKCVIGLDTKAARIFPGANFTNEAEIKNAFFIIGRAELIEKMFQEIKFNEIWITFPDPVFKRRAELRRLISPLFLQRYKNISFSNVVINLKTDNLDLYKYTLEVIKKFEHQLIFETADLYKDKNSDSDNFIQTYYEKHYIAEGRKIKLIKFKLNQEV